jgi:HPt (histidine-containing phosphotransfer) domain-containing protein
VTKISEKVPGNFVPKHGATEVLPIDRADLLQRVGGDLKLLAELVELFRQHCPVQLAELREAVALGAPIPVAHVSHALRGGLITLGAAAASKSAMRLEGMGRNANLTGAAAELVILEREIVRAQAELTRICQAVKP